MALQAGDAQARSGMSSTIYQQINAILSPDIDPAALPKVQTSWKKLAFAIASGVIASLKSDMEIAGIQASGSFTAPVVGVRTITGPNVIALTVAPVLRSADTPHRSAGWAGGRR